MMKGLRPVTEPATVAGFKATICMLQPDPVIAALALYDPAAPWTWSSTIASPEVDLTIKPEPGTEHVASGIQKPQIRSFADVVVALPLFAGPVEPVAPA